MILPTQPLAFTATHRALLQTRQAPPAPVRTAVAPPARLSSSVAPTPAQGRYVDLLV